VNRRKGVAKPDEQGRAFIAKARELGCDEDPEAFERVFARIVPPKRPPESVAQNKHAKRTATKRRLIKASTSQS
jgi:hypothetical protein